MPDYSKCVIYKLQCKETKIKEIYIGSTCNFTNRKRHHKSDCNNIKTKRYNYKVYQFIRKNGNWDNWDMIPVEKYPCKDKIEKLIRERYWFDKLKATLNDDTPNRTQKEYQQLPKQKIKKQEYQKKNKESCNENKRNFYNRNNYKITCECGYIISKIGKPRHEKTKKHINFINQK